MIKSWLVHPLGRSVPLDDPEATAHHRQILEQKDFLRRLYEEWYGDLAAAVPPGRRPALEIGSGPGFLSRVIPNLVTSDVIPASGVRVVLDAAQLPFGDGALRAIVMTNVLHHLPQPRSFFLEAARVVERGGVLVMIEPWLSAWSRFVYQRLHHEPCDPAAARWEFPSGGRLSAANSALPWIVFHRDRAIFEREFPQWRIDRVGLELGTPFRYLVSGGVSLRSLTPRGTFAAWRSVERALSPWMTYWAMFALIRLERIGA
jgi:SAM-dependent methyltransferase